MPFSALTVAQPPAQTVQRPVEDAGQLGFQLLGQQHILLFLGDALGEGHQPDAPPDARVGTVEARQVVRGFQQLELGAELELLAVLEQGVGLGAQGIQRRARCGR